MQKFKAFFICLIIVLQTFVLFGQEEENNPPLLATDTTWGKEVFTFPLGFAQEIKYEGIEEAYFPKGWSKQDHDDFWSYAFVWKIDHDKTLTTNELERDVQFYFNGLMDMNQNGTKENEIYLNPRLYLYKTMLLLI